MAGRKIEGNIKKKFVCKKSNYELHYISKTICRTNG